MTEVRPIRVLLDAMIAGEGAAGGVEQFVIGLASGLRSVAPADIDFTFIGYEDALDWLGPYVEPHRLRISHRPRFGPAKAWLAGRLPVLRSAKDLLRPGHLAPAAARIGALEADVIHFTHQRAFLTPIPSLYQPHDLQHRHLPEMFSEADARGRETLYREFCTRAALVVTPTSWVRDDVIAAYPVLPERVAVVPYAPAPDRQELSSQDDLRRIELDLGLPHRFALYPAQTWPHKNHEGLMRAAALLKTQGRTVPLVFSGHVSKEARVRLPALARQLGISDEVKILGFVDPKVLAALYRLAHCVVVPSLFEGWCFPIWEAFKIGVPVACSDIESLPQRVRDCAVRFDPRSGSSMAAAIVRVSDDVRLRQELVECGRALANEFTGERSTRLLVAHYRRIGGAHLDEEDRSLLAAPPLI